MKTLLTMTRADEERNVEDGAEATFTVMINPEQMRQGQQLYYAKTQTQGQKGQRHRFAAVGPDTVTFDLVLDGTGIVRQDMQAEDVTQQLNKLRSIVYQVNGEKRQPNHVRLLWGTFLFFGQLTTLNTSFTLFKPSGEPLRAKVSLSFVGSVRNDDKELERNAPQGKVVQQVKVRDGDTLALLCFRIYGDSSRYLEVAELNGLDRIEPLKAGTTLKFPERS